MKKVLILMFLTTGITGCYLTREVPLDEGVWDYGYPSEFGMNDDLLYQTNELIRVGTYENIHSLMIVKNDHLIYERHYGSNNRHTIKSIDRMSLLLSQIAIGIAIDKGLIESVDVPIWELLSDYESVFADNPDKQAITIKHLLTHRSGLAWNEAIVPIQSENSDFHLMKLSPNWATYILEKPLDAPPGFRYSINSGTGIILSKIIEEASGQTMEQFLESTLFAPMEINEYHWESDPSGTTNGSDGLSISTIDFAKIGFMLLNDGLWNGREIISLDWLIESSNMQNLVSNQFGFGYYWWKFNDDYAFESFPFTNNDVTFIYNFTGTSLYLVPHQDLMILIMANNSFYDFFSPSLRLYDNILESFK